MENNSSVELEDTELQLVIKLLSNTDMAAEDLDRAAEVILAIKRASRELESIVPGLEMFTKFRISRATPQPDE